MLRSLAKELMILRALGMLIAISLGILSPVLANATQTSSELSASNFKLPDGTVPIICFGNGDSTSNNAVHCDDCLLHNNPIANLPSIESAPLPLVIKSGIDLANLASNSPPDFLKRQQSRAPPLI